MHRAPRQRGKSLLWVYVLSLICSRNNSMVRIGRNLKDHLLPTPLPWAGTPSQLTKIREAVPFTIRSQFCGTAEEHLIGRRFPWQGCTVKDPTSDFLVRRYSITAEHVIPHKYFAQQLFLVLQANTIVMCSVQFLFPHVKQICWLQFERTAEKGLLPTAQPSQKPICYQLPVWVGSPPKMYPLIENMIYRIHKPPIWTEILHYWTTLLEWLHPEPFTALFSSTLQQAGLAQPVRKRHSLLQLSALWGWDTSCAQSGALESQFPEAQHTTLSLLHDSSPFSSWRKEEAWGGPGSSALPTEACPGSSCHLTPPGLLLHPATGGSADRALTQPTSLPH